MLARAGIRVRCLREKLGLSVPAAAQAAGVPEYYLARLEAGEVEFPNFSVLGQIARALGSDLDQLCEGPEQVISGGAPRLRPTAYEIHLSPDWPRRLLNAVRIELALARGADDAFGIEVWRAAQRTLADLYAPQARKLGGAA